jgi:hypothetical protein
MRPLSPSCSAFVLFLASSISAAAQDAPLPELDDLKAPASPAFVILDVAPSKVERPQALKPLVLSAITASDEGFPKNYAVEFSPYWLGTPRLTFADYYGANLMKNTLRHLSMSVATTPLGKTPELGTAVAIGARTLPVPGRAHPTLASLQKKLAPLQRTALNLQSIDNRRAQVIKLLREALAAAMKEDEAVFDAAPFKPLVDEALRVFIEEVEERKTVIAGLKKELDEERLSEAERKQREDEIKKLEGELETITEESGKVQAAQMLDAFRGSLLPSRLTMEQGLTALIMRLDDQFKTALERTETQLKATALKIQALDTQRVGFMLAAAGAASWDVPADVTAEARLGKLGVWLTPGYRIVRCNADGECSQPVDLLAVFRYLDSRRAGEETTWEIGGRLLWQPAAKLAVSGEWLARTGDDETNDRVVGVAEYEISSSAYLYASFGRDFEEKGTRRNLVSAIGITFGFGKKPIVTATE